MGLFGEKHVVMSFGLGGNHSDGVGKTGDLNRKIKEKMERAGR